MGTRRDHAYTQKSINRVKTETTRFAQTCTQVTSSKLVCVLKCNCTSVPSQKPSDGQASQLDSTGSSTSNSTLKPINLPFVYACNGEIEKRSWLTLLFTLSHVVDFHDKVLKISVLFELWMSLVIQCTCMGL